MSRWFVGRAAAEGPRYYRQSLPLRHLGADLAQAGIEINYSVNLSEAFAADVCLFSRCIGADVLSAVLMLKKAGKIIVWDTDDDLTIRERFVPGEQGKSAKEVAAFHACLDLADLITVSVPDLASALGRQGKTIVLPNLIDLDDNPIDDSTGERNSILYCGSSTHGRDITLFQNLYEETKHEYPWVFVGIEPEWCDTSATVIPMPSITSYPRVCRLARPRYALAPLEVDRFNLSKSPIKIWETATFSDYVVATNFGPYAGTAAGIVPPGERFTQHHLALSHDRQSQCREEAVANSWQGSPSARGWWLDTFKMIEGMARG